MTDDLDGAVPLAEAAQRLGIREELVRQRIYRGKLRGHKVDGRWHVVVPDNKTGSDNSYDGQDNLSPQEQDSFDAIHTLIESQQQQISFLQGELSARTEELRRKDIIIHELTTQLKALPEAIVEVQAEQQRQLPEEPAPASKRPWWRFWEMT